MRSPANPIVPEYEPNFEIILDESDLSGPEQSLTDEIKKKDAIIDSLVRDVATFQRKISELERTNSLQREMLTTIKKGLDEVAKHGKAALGPRLKG